MANKTTAGRAAERIVRRAESEGARREREIHELQEQFDAPASGRPEDRESPQEDHDRADRAFSEAMDSVTSILGDSQLGAVLKLALATSNDDMLVAEFCYDLAGETGGETSGWFAALAEALEQQHRTGEEYNKAVDRLPNRFGPEGD